MKKTIKLNEKELYRLISESVKEEINHGNYRKYMNDNDIEAQYDNAEITYLNIKPFNNGECWSGCVEITFPNADGVDFDNTKIDNFIVYDRNGDDIAFDHWYPDNVSDNLKKAIRKKIYCMNSGNSACHDNIDNAIQESVRRTLREHFHMF